MNRKVLLAVLCVLLLSIATVLPVWAAGEAQDVSWATLTYVYDPDVEGQTPRSGNISFTKGQETCLERLSTVTWDADRADLYVDGVLCEGGSVRIERAREYELTVVNKSNNELRYSCTVRMLPVIRADGEYFSVNPETGSFDPVSLARFPLLECLNVDRAELDGKAMNMAGETVDRFGKHTLSLYSGNILVGELNFRVLLCVAQRVYAGNGADVNALKLTVGEFPREVELFLDGSDTPLAPGATVITALGQHTLRARMDGMEVSAASGALPAAEELCLQFELFLPSDTLSEPLLLLFSNWDATFFVNGREYRGEDCRITKAGKNVIYAVDENGEQIASAFYLRTEEPAQGNVCDEVVLVFRNYHYIYAIVLSVLAVLASAAAVYFFLRRRSVV